MSFSNEKPFSIHEIGEVTGETYAGDFVALKFLPSRLVFRRDQLIRGFLAGDNPMVSGQVDRADIFATVQSSLSESPDWWKDKGQGLELLDFNVVKAVYDQIVKIQTEAQKVVQDRAKAAAATLTQAAQEAAAKQK